MASINLFVKGQSLRLTNSCYTIVSDTINYITAEVKFLTDDWSGLVKWLHFKQGDKVYDIQLNVEDRIDQNAGVNLEEGQWELYIHGNRITDGETTQRITTNIVTILVQKTGVLEGEPLPEIAPSAGEQILATAEDAKRIAQSVRDDADNGKFKGDPGPKGEPGYTPVRGVDYWTEEDLAPIEDVTERANEAAEKAESVEGRLSESISEIEDELNNIIVTVFSQKESTANKWNFFIINHTFETDSKLVISCGGKNYGLNYSKNGEYVNVGDYGLKKDTIVSVAKGDRIDVVQVITYADCTVTCKVVGDRIEREYIPESLIVHNYGTLVKQYGYGMGFYPINYGGRFYAKNNNFITNPLPIIKGKDIYIDATYTSYAVFYDEAGEYLGYKELYYRKPIRFDEIFENAYYVSFSVGTVSPVIDKNKLNTNTFNNQYTRRNVSERNYMEGTRLETYIYTTDSIEEIVAKMHEAVTTGNVDVHWECGTYNLNGLYDVFSTMYRFSGFVPRGILIGNNCRYYFNNAMLTKDMSDVPIGSGYNSDILEGVQYNTGESCDFEIYDLNIHGTGIVYCIHDDVGSGTIYPTHRKYVNCKMKYTATSQSNNLSKCIGGGTGRITYREIDNCTFFMDGESSAISTFQEVSYHGSKDDAEEGYFQLKVHDCYFENSIGQHSLDIKQTADFYMSNCSLASYKKPSGEKWHSYVWNNEIRS